MSNFIDFEKYHFNEFSLQLFSLLDKEIKENVPGFYEFVEALDLSDTFWLVNTVSKELWFNQMAFYCLICNRILPNRGTRYVSTLIAFIRWAVPERYPSIDKISPVKALLSFIKSTQATSIRCFKAYRSLQYHMSEFMEGVPLQQKKILSKYLLPYLPTNKQLTRINRENSFAAKRRRKQKSDPLVTQLNYLKNLGKARLIFLDELNRKMEEEINRIKNSSDCFPGSIKVQWLDEGIVLEFRVWSSSSFVETYPEYYKATTMHRKKNLNAEEEMYFLQLVSPIPEKNWFLSGVNLNIFGSSARTNPSVKEYLRRQGLPIDIFSSGTIRSVLLPDNGLSIIMGKARRVLEKSGEDSVTIFSPSNFLVASAIGYSFLLIALSTGMRIGEIQQIILDADHLTWGYLSKYNDQTGEFDRGSEHYTCWIYPKGKDVKVPVRLSVEVIKMIGYLKTLHKKFPETEDFGYVDPAQKNRFLHAYKFPEKYKFVFQWDGKHLPNSNIYSCMSFLLLEHGIKDTSGHQVGIRPHSLRHAFAGDLHLRGYPLHIIQRILNHVNQDVTQHYASSSEADEQFYERIAPIITDLDKIVSGTSEAVRSFDELKSRIIMGLKQYGVLRNIPGGECGSYCSCVVDFKCASCMYYIPVLSKKEEVMKKISVQKEIIKFYLDAGDSLSVDRNREFLRGWEGVLKQMLLWENSVFLNSGTVDFLEDIKRSTRDELNLSLLLSDSCLEEETDEPTLDTDQNIPDIETRIK